MKLLENSSIHREFFHKAMLTRLHICNANPFHVMIRFICVLLLLAAPRLFAAKFNPFDGPAPIAVLVTLDPWSNVMGAETPRVALYEDGTLIFLKKTGEGQAYFQKTLSSHELDGVKKRLARLKKLKNVKRSYTLTDATDRPITEFYIRAGQVDLTTDIYGMGFDGIPKSGSGGPILHVKIVPKPILAAHKFLTSLDYADAHKWTPQYVEVMLWPYEYAPEASIIWPKDWPGLDSDRAIQRRDSYSIFLDAKLLPDVEKFVSTRKEKGAVQLGGKKWAISYRYFFPSEPVWRKAFEATADN